MSHLDDDAVLSARATPKRACLRERRPCRHVLHTYEELRNEEDNKEGAIVLYCVGA